MFFLNWCSEKFHKNYRKKTAPESLFNKAAVPQQIFNWRLPQQLARTFNSIWSREKYSENVYTSLKTKYKYQVTYLKIKINCEIILRAVV